MMFPRALPEQQTEIELRKPLAENLPECKVNWIIGMKMQTRKMVRIGVHRLQYAKHVILEPGASLVIASLMCRHLYAAVFGVVWQGGCKRFFLEIKVLEKRIAKDVFSSCFSVDRSAAKKALFVRGHAYYIPYPADAHHFRAFVDARFRRIARAGRESATEEPAGTGH